MIINVRGTSGSGKTTVVRGLMALAAQTFPLGEKLKKPDAYVLTLDRVAQPLHIIGSYENVCGGCDGIPTQDDICNRVRRYSAQGHVVMEGLLMSHLFGRYQALDRELQPIPYIWAFLDTPLELCLERVTQRRLARGNDKPLDPTNTSAKWHDMRRVFAKCQAAGLDARWVDHTDPVPQVMEWLRGA